MAWDESPLYDERDTPQDMIKHSRVVVNVVNQLSWIIRIHDMVPVVVGTNK